MVLSLYCVCCLCYQCFVCVQIMRSWRDENAGEWFASRIQLPRAAWRISGCMHCALRPVDVSRVHLSKQTLLSTPVVRLSDERSSVRSQLTTKKSLKVVKPLLPGLDFCSDRMVFLSTGLNESNHPSERHGMYSKYQSKTSLKIRVLFKEQRRHLLYQKRTRTK